MCELSCFSCVQIFATQRNVALQAPLSRELSKQEYWSGLPCPAPGDLLDSGIELASLTCPALAGGLFTISATWEAPYDPESSLLGIYPEETTIEKDTCTLMFTAALFTIARKWKQPRCLSTDEWINKLWHTNTVRYYLDTEKNAFESVLMRWLNLETIIQSEVSQKEKNKYSILMHIFGI